ncbi:MAG: hypothetical protein KF832_04595 [Caldilineaceae bacterium]|nr:hypothetical protein [Caldilineaceae bacterium]
MAISYLSSRKRSSRKRTLHYALYKSVTIGVLAALLAGLLPPPLVSLISPQLAALLPAPKVAQAAGSASGGIFQDINGDGLDSGPGEPGVAGVTVTAYSATGAGAGTVVATATSDAAGSYTLDLSALATFIPLRFEFTNFPAGYSASPFNSASAGSKTNVRFFSTINGNTTAINFGLVNATTSIEIGNRVWRDADSDGIQDPNETAIAGVVIGLYNSSGTLIDTVTTATDGTYYFSSASGTDVTGRNYGVSLQPNTAYTVAILDSNFASGKPLNGLVVTTANSQGDTSNDSINDLRDSDGVGVSVGSGTNLATQSGVSFTTGVAGANNHSFDFGFTQTGTLQIVKQTVGNDGTFNFALTNPDATQNAVSITTVGNTGNSGTPSTKLMGSYIVSEDQPPANWALTGLSCTGDTDNGSLLDPGSRKITIDLDAGENIVCTFTNTYTLPGVVQVTKQVMTTDGSNPTISGNFTINIACGNASISPGNSQTVAAGNSITFSNIPAGSLCTIEENTSTLPAAPAGYSWAAFQVTPSQFMMGTGQTVLVTAKNILMPQANGKNTLTVTKTIAGTGSGPFAITVIGASGYLSATTINGGQSKVFTGLVGGVYTVTENTPAGWTTVYTATPGTGGSSQAVVTLQGSNTATLAAAPISGKVFRDFNSDGLLTANGVITDTGVSGVTVTAYDKNGKVVGSATSGADGTYTINPTGAGPYRVVFSNLPADYEPTTHGTNNGTSVQFVNTAAQASNVNLGILAPCLYCQNNPSIATVVMNVNDAPTMDPTIVDFSNSVGIPFTPYSTVDANYNWAYPTSIPANPALRTVAKIGDVGSVMGLAWDRLHSRLFTSAYGRGWSKIKANSSANGYAEGAIYQVPYVANAPNTPTLWLDLETLFGNDFAGTFTLDRASSFIGANRTNDYPNLVGYTGLGGMAVSNNGDELYVVNLNAPEVLAIPVDSNGNPPASSGAIKRFPFPTADCPSGTWSYGRSYRAAFGVTVYPPTGEVYATLTCTGPTVADMKGLVYAFDPSSPTPSAADMVLKLTIPMNVLHPTVTNASSWYAETLNEWRNLSGYAYDFQPLSKNVMLWLGEPVFNLRADGGYDLTVAERNRYYDMAGDAYWVAAGAMYKACSTGSSTLPTWTLENNKVCGSATSTVNWTYGSGRAGASTDITNRFYKYVGAEGAMMQGTLATIPGSSEIVGVGLDAEFNAGTHGVAWFNLSTGERQRHAQFTTYKHFGKANNHGDIEVLCNPAPIEIGNRVWDDLNGNGVQDAGEPGVTGVQVSLQGPTNTVQTTTDSNGNYYFNNLLAHTAYTLTMDVPADYSLTAANQAALSGATASSNDPISDTIDSDAVLIGGKATIFYTTGGAGQNNHGLGFGFAQPVSGQVDILNIAPASVNTPTATPTNTPTNTPVGPTATPTNTPTDTPVGPTATPTDTPVGPTATPTDTPVGPTATPTDTPVGPTATPTNTPVGPTATPTNTPVGPTATPTNTPVGPTSTPTNTPVGPTATPTDTPVGPTSTPTDTPVGPTATPTNTPVGPTATPTNTPVGPTATPTDTTLVSIGNQVWQDDDNNGRFDTIEMPIPHLLMELWVDLDQDGIAEPQGDDAVQIPLTTTTSISGTYRFSDLLPGNYFVRIPEPPRAIPLSSFPYEEPDDGVDNNDNGRQPAGPATQVLSSVIRLDLGEEPGTGGGGHYDYTVDFGLVDPFIGNLVWYDQNNNGWADDSEPGIPNVTIYLLEDTNNNGVIDPAEQTPVRTIATNPDGLYAFMDIGPGSYQVVIPASNFAPGQPLAAYPSSSTPTNLNDDQQDDDDNGFQVGRAMTTTSPIVTLSVDGEPANGVSETGRGNWLDDGDDNNGDMTIDFGFAPLAQFGDRVWIESDTDGRAGTGSLIPVAGMVITATDGLHRYTTTTTAQGYYSFTVNAGTYTVTYGSVPASYGSVTLSDTPGGSSASGNAGLYAEAGRPDQSHVNGTTVTVAEGEANWTVDFAFHAAPVQLGDRVWIESDSNGDASDGVLAGLGGLTIMATASDGTTVYTTTTDIFGYYTLIVPAYDTYTVTTEPVGDLFASPVLVQDGSDPVNNNDRNHDRLGTTVVMTTTDNLSIDFGFSPAAQFGDRVWIESDGDGDAATGSIIPVAGMGLIATASNGTDFYLALTNVDGYYSFIVPAGTYTVTYGTVPATYGLVVPSDTPGGNYESGNAGFYSEPGDPDRSHAQHTRVTVASGEANWHVDFAFSPPLVSLGNRLFYDTNDDGLDNDGLSRALGSSAGIDGATVQLYQDTNGNGRFDLSDTPLLNTTTQNGGYYTFTKLMPTVGITSTYLVVIPSSNFVAGGPLVGYLSSTDIATTLTPDDDRDFDDNGEVNGVLGQASGFVASRAVTVTLDGEPINENNGGNDPTDDNDSNQTIDFGFFRYDWGDLPAIYATLAVANGARHQIDPLANPILGTIIDSEYDGQPTVGAGGDDLTGRADEDGVVIPTLQPNTTVNLTVTYSNPTTGTVYLNGWIDFNADGVMGAGEQVITDTTVPTGTGQLIIPMTVPATTHPGEVYARFRISRVAGLGMTGAAPDGEVEDYLAFTNVADLGDLPDRYGTLKSSDGARHLLTSNTRLNGSVDSDPDGMPSLGADGDDTDTDVPNAGDDENGVTWPPVILPNSTVPITVVVATTGTAYLNAWIDFNGDGDFEDEQERIVMTDTAYTTGTHVFNISAPSFVTTTLYARFRLTDNPGEATTPTGSAPSGEVEDYVRTGVGNTVWLDNGQGGGLANNGIRDGGEVGIPGVTVELYRGTDTPGVATPLAVLTTDDAGHYFFTGLPPGDYVIHIPAENFDESSDPLYQYLSSTGAGLSTTVADENVDENGIDNPNPAVNGISSGVVPLGAVGNVTIDFAFLGYDFGDLPDGPYATLLANNGPRHVVSPDLYFGASVDVDADGQPDVNAGLGSNLGGDDQADGNDDEDGIGIPALMANTERTIFLFTHVTPTVSAYYGAFIDFDGDGNFGLDEIYLGVAGDGYNTVSISMPSFVSDTVYARFRIAENQAEVSTPTGLALSGEVEDYVLMSLGNQLWFDTNNNGLFDPGEVPVPAGVKVTLLEEGVTSSWIAETTTDSNGRYLFTGLLPDTYQVRVEAENFQPGGLLAGYVGSTGQDGGDAIDNNDNGADGGDPTIVGIISNVIPLVAGDEPTTDGNGPSSNLTVDFGFWQPLSLGNRVWLDTGTGSGQFNNGLDDDESGIRDVVLLLLTGDGSTYDRDPLTPGTQLYTATTNATGYYSFTNLIAGAYHVRVRAGNFAAGGALAGYVSSNDPATGANPDNDVDRDDNGPGTASAVVTSGVITLTYGGEPDGTHATDGDDDASTNWTVDFGFWLPAAIGDRVWYDVDSNGVQDLGETGVTSVTVELLDGTGALLRTTSTNASGVYSFTHLVPGSYHVRFVLSSLPLGYILTQPDQGDDSMDSDADPTTGETPLATLDPGEFDPTWDAGIRLPLLSLGNYVWLDGNRDGQQTPNEPGVPGIVVTLTLTTGQRFTTTTDETGFYTFTQLAPNQTVTVTFGLPMGYSVTTPNQGDDTLDSDPDNTGRVVVSLGTTSDQTIDLGLVVIPVVVGDWTFIDMNRNGVQDAGDLPLPGVVLQLTKADGSAATTILGTPVADQTTDGNGHYRFGDLPPGEYTVKVVSVPSGYVPTTPQVGTPDLDSSTTTATSSPTTGTAARPGGEDLTLDFGFIPVVGLGNLVWHDQNNNGLVDNGEPGIGAVRLQLFRADDDPLTATPVATTTTDVQGIYQFVNLAPGRYFVYIPTPPMQAPVSSTPTDAQDNGEDNDDNGSQSQPGGPVRSPVIELQVGTEPTNDGDGANLDLTVDFGFFAFASLGDLVWFDSNADGIQDAQETGEPGLGTERGVPNVLVTLYEALTNHVVMTTTTDTSGRYGFTNLLPGSYVVAFGAPAGYLPTAPDKGNNDAFDSDADLTTLRTPTTTLTSGQHNPTLDFGLFLPNGTQPAAIGNFVWFDTDKDGVQDPGETGVAGVKVTLYSSGGSLVATTMTDGAGLYQFNSLPPGSYYLLFAPPTGYGISPQNSGSRDDLDSDADPSTGQTAVTTLEPGELDLSWDLGLTLSAPPASLGNYIWYDSDRDGIQDAGETGVPGVTMILYTAAGNLIATTHTNADGFYSFGNLLPGDYILEAAPRPGYVPTLPNQGSDDATDSDINPLTRQTSVITLHSGEQSLVWDVGLVIVSVRSGALEAPAALGNRVWEDKDQDGRQDEPTAEPNVPGLVVKLYDGNGLFISDDITDEKGEYYFLNLLPGAYYVEFVLPTGYSITVIGTDPASDVDSNVDPKTGRTTVVTLAAGEVNLTIDAGIYRRPTNLEEAGEPQLDLSNRIYLPMIQQ